MSAVERYRALALQTRCDSVSRLDVDQARAQMAQTIARVGGQIATSRMFIGADVKLVVLPEYFLTSYPTSESIPEWREKAALSIDGPEYKALGDIARSQGIYLCGNAYEIDDAFNDLYFQTCFIIDPAGNVVLRYRRLISMYAPTPHDVWDKYLEVHGYDAVFPVIDTPLGRLAAIASEEILYPEIARAFALGGAEVLLHSTSEVGSPQLTPKDIGKRARAVENSVYVVSANSAGIFSDNVPFPAHATDGMSKVVGLQGEVLAEAGYGETMVANAIVDIEAQRAWRRRPGMGNMISRQRTELFRPVYEQTVHAANKMLDDAGEVIIPERAQFVQTQVEIIQRLVHENKL